jgi:hypothetical protein
MQSVMAHREAYTVQDSTQSGRQCSASHYSMKGESVLPGVNLLSSGTVSLELSPRGRAGLGSGISSDTRRRFA